MVRQSHESVYFVWSDPLPIVPGFGGSEAYTIGHVRELRERGIDAQIITIGLGKNDGRNFFPEIPFIDMATPQPISDLHGKIIYVKRYHDIKTSQPSFLILHDPPPAFVNKSDVKKFAKRRMLMVNSQFNQRMWAEYLDIPLSTLYVVYPFADPYFAQVKRPMKTSKITKVLFAGRLCPEKGVYTLLEALHHDELQNKFHFTFTESGTHRADGRMIRELLRCHPWVNVIPQCKSVVDMAKLYSQHAVIVMPSNHQYWHETFGMVSVEAQHTGCRVVASDDGGLPETNCGGLILFEPGSSYMLAQAIQKAAHDGLMSNSERNQAAKLFGRAESTDTLLSVLYPELVNDINLQTVLSKHP